MERDVNQFAQMHSIHAAQLRKAEDRLARLENLVIMLEAELAKTEEKLALCEKVLADLKITPYHPTMID